MTNKIFGNFVNGKARLYQKALQTPKIYDSMHQFLVDYPLPTDLTNKGYAHTFYWALLTGVRDADLPLEQRPIRSRLLVKTGIESGIINTNKGARL
jgi:hypothetical protein